MTSLFLGTRQREVYLVMRKLSKCQILLLKYFVAIAVLALLSIVGFLLEFSSSIIAALWLAIIMIIVIGVKAVRNQSKQDIIDKEKNSALTAPESVQKIIKQIDSISDVNKLSPTDLDKIGITSILYNGLNSREETIFFFSVGTKNYAYSNNRLIMSAPTITFGQHYEGTMVYHPSDIRYTGATFGGVTVGKIRDVGNYHSLEAHKTDKYTIGCNISSISINVTMGKFNTQLMSKIKRHHLLSTLQITESNTVFFSKRENKYLQTRGHESASNMYNRTQMEYTSNLLNRNECIVLAEWLCSDAVFTANISAESSAQNNK